MKRKMTDEGRQKEDGLAKRYGRIGMRVVAAAAPYQPKPEDHPTRAQGKRANRIKSKKGIAANQ